MFRKRHWVSLSALVCTGSALAHPGHDHSHWSSPAVHGLLLLAIVVTVGVAIGQCRKVIKSRQQQGDQ